MLEAIAWIMRQLAEARAEVEKPLWLSAALILEEGLDAQTLSDEVEAMAAARRVGVTVVAGDTKVVQRGKADMLYVTTTGYEMARHWVSLLSLGSRGWLGTMNLLVSGVLIAASSLGLGQVVRGRPSGAWMARGVGAVGIAFVGAGIFPIGPVPGYPTTVPLVASVTTSGWLHDMFGGVAFIALTMACFAGARYASAQGWGRAWVRVATACGAVVVVAFVALSVLAGLETSGVLPWAPGGAVQRVHLVAGLGWVAAVATRERLAGAPGATALAR